MRIRLALFAWLVLLCCQPADGATFQALSLNEDPLIWGRQGNLASRQCAISGNGLVVGFESMASQLIPQDRNGQTDVFVQTGGSLFRLSRRISGADARRSSNSIVLSETGRYVVFESDDNLQETAASAGFSSAYWVDRQTGTLLQASRTLSGARARVGQVSISGNGRYVFFDSNDANIVAGDSNAAQDIFRFDTQTALTILVSSSNTGVQGNSSSVNPSADLSGTLVAFESDASNFVAGDTVTRDVFVKNLSTAAVIRASQTSAGVGGALPSTQPHLASNGNFVVFQTGSQLDRSNPDNNGLSDITDTPCPLGIPSARLSA